MVIPATPASAMRTRAVAGWFTGVATVLIGSGVLALVVERVTALSVAADTTRDYEEWAAHDLTSEIGGAALAVGAVLVLVGFILRDRARRRWVYNPPPGWPEHEPGWVTTHPVPVALTCPPAPEGWQFWVDARA